MKAVIALCLLAFVAGSSAQNCPTMKWANCDGGCSVLVGDGTKQPLDCTKLIPKCFLMKAEVYRATHGMDTRSIGGKPVETAFVDNDGIYDPICENDGTFKAIQCNNTDTCWCVNSAGVRRSDKGDKNIKCEPVETYWVRIELKHKDVGPIDPSTLKTGIANALQNRYKMPQTSANTLDVQYDEKARLIIVDVQKPKGDRATDLSRMAYYMEKDVKVLPLFKDPSPFQLVAGKNNLTMETILVYYVDEVAPTFTMQRLTGGVIAVIVVVVLAVVVGLLVLFFVRKRDKAQYTKAQARELENMS
ncbi:epithelial cell adhesion molecule [Brachyhypopomus gauderio]|uniref:epithelial cell adhesion molecule n=1 Tax=Brachyhypopomus gauderio TaxID=698409 RepID=UPI004043483C